MKILYVDSCISCGKSRTAELAEVFINCLRESVCSAEIITEDLTKSPYLPLNEQTLAERDCALREGRTDIPLFAPAHKFADADEIVIAAPYWDLSFPSELKAYVEHIMINGVTFTYESNGPKGLCRAEKLTYITTSGGYIGQADFGFEYVKTIANMLGIADCRKFSAEGLDIDGVDVKSVMAKATDEIKSQFKSELQCKK